MSSARGSEGRSPVPNLRVVAGMKPPQGPAPRRFVDKNARPAHRQLRMITIPTWLPWVAKLLEPITLPPARLRSSAATGSSTTTFGWRKGGIAGLLCLLCGFVFGAALWYVLHRFSGTTDNANARSGAPSRSQATASSHAPRRAPNAGDAPGARAVRAR